MPETGIKILEETTQKWGYTCADIARDGNSFFNAMSIQLKKLGVRQHAELTAVDLRKITARHIDKNRDQYKTLISDFSSVANLDIRLNLHLHNLLRDGTYAHSVDVIALARELCVNLVVITQGVFVYRHPQPSGTIVLGFLINDGCYLPLEKSACTPIHDIEAAINTTSIDAVEEFILVKNNPITSDIATAAIIEAAKTAKDEQLRKIFSAVGGKSNFSTKDHNPIYWALHNPNDVMHIVANPLIVANYKDGTTELHANGALGDTSKVAVALKRKPKAYADTNDRGETLLYFAGLTLRSKVVRYVLMSEAFKRDDSEHKYLTLQQGLCDRHDILRDQYDRPDLHLEELTTLAHNKPLNFLTSEIQLLIHIYSLIPEAELTDESKQALAECYTALGFIFALQPRYEIAETMFECAINYWEQLADETRGKKHFLTCINQRLEYVRSKLDCNDPDDNCSPPPVTSSSTSTTATASHGYQKNNVFKPKPVRPAETASPARPSTPNPP